MRLGQAGVGHRDRDEADRDVDPEDPLPGEALGDRPADERPDRDREAGDAAPRAERDARVARGGTAADRIVRLSGVMIAPPTPWMARATISVRDVRRERGDRRAAGEDREADDEQALPAEPVAERGAGQEQDRERQRVGVDDPLELGQVGVEALPG